jgi:hypothetical protein
MRTIMQVDLDTFYSSIEQRDRDGIHAWNRAVWITWKEEEARVADLVQTRLGT